mgnify:CR=1 FL=1
MKTYVVFASLLAAFAAAGYAAFETRQLSMQRQAQAATSQAWASKVLQVEELGGRRALVRARPVAA